MWYYEVLLTSAFGLFRLLVLRIISEAISNLHFQYEVLVGNLNASIWMSVRGRSVELRYERIQLKSSGHGTELK